jgi:subtilisin family serine protease
MKPTSASLPPAISPADQSPRRQRLCFAWLLPLLLLSAAWPVMGQWSQVADTGPAARYYTAMAEAPGLGQTILFGGFTGAAQGDTWNWNGSTWQPLAPLAPTPSPRYTHGMAWLPRPGGGQLVLFGGINATGGTLGDTWVWEGAGWRQITGPMPPTRFVVSMASEPTRGRAVMFGGFTGSTVRGDTWTFNGTAWTQHTVTGPSARGGHAMAYDARRDRVVLFGGQTAPNVLSRETWEWVDNAWALVTTNGPAARRDFAMAYRNGRVVLYGGAAGNDVLGDTWELEGAEWVQTAAGCPQPPRFAHAMTTETAGRTVALFGGGFEDLLGDTWRYSGGIIAVPPSDLTVVAGQPATFMVQVGGGGEVSYQWERACGGAGFTAIGGATNSTYTLSAAALGDACLYRCVVSMGACATPSAAARLSVLPADSGPVITRQPSSLTVTPGQPASFTVTAAGAAPLSYQWYQNGQALAGFTIQALDLGPAWPDDAGNYRVVVSNPSGSVTSAPATLSLNVVAPSNQWNVWVDTAASLALVESEVGARGGQVRETSLYFLRVSFSSTEAVFQQIAGLPGVLRAEPQYLPGLFNYNSRTAINTSKVQAAPYGSGVPGLTGLGVVAGVWDGGTAGLTHPDWFPRLTVMENCAPNFGNDTHAAHVIGTMAGDGTIWFNSLAGMAPAATIKDWSFNFCPGFSAPSPFTEMLNARNIGASAWPAPAIDYSQNSWGYVPLNCALYGSYIGDCGDADKLVRQEYLPIFFAAGNSQNGLTTSMAPCGSPYGTVLPPGTAKNVITVGAIDMLDAITVFSSCGPTRDGRLKPDVMALGLGVYSTTDPGWQGVGYFVLSGTSMATPAVSGTAALLIEQFRNLTLPDPSPALLKAIFCNTATDLGNAGPDFQYGYGKVNAEKAVETIVNGDFVDVMANSSGTPGGITQGGVWARSITVPQGCALKVTLAWSDKEYLGTNPHGATLINDLDLHLIDPSSGLHLPLTLNPGTPAALAVPALNRRDNVEQVVVSSAQGGAWSIVVTGFNVPVGPQEFAVTWCIVCPPPCQPQPIQGLWNTGYDTNGNVLPSGAIDPHYALISSPAGFTDARHNYFGSPWLPDGPNSWWLQPGPPAFAPNGTYIYEVTFDLGNCDPNTASITGRWAADDWADLRINNVPVPGVSAAYGFGAWAPLSINSGFVPGVNTIQFVVRNLGAALPDSGLS